MNLPGKVSYYTMARATVSIGFPEDRVCCQWCRYLKQERMRSCCQLTNEVLVYPESGVGNECPIEIIGRSDDLSAV